MEIAQTMKGMVESFGGHIVIPALLECIKQEDTGLLTLSIGVENIALGIKECKEGECTIDHGAGDIIGGTAFVFGGWNTMKKYVPLCESAWVNSNIQPEFHRIMENVKNMVHDKSAKIDKALIAEEVVMAAEYLEEKNYYEFGKEIGQILKSLNTAKPAFEVVDPKKKMEHLAELTAGFYNGVGVNMGWNQLLECIYLADGAAEMAYADYTIWEEFFATHQLVSLFGALVFAFLTFQNVRQQVLPHCVPLSNTDFTPYDKVAQVLGHPSSLIKLAEKEIVFNGKSVTEEVVAAVKSCEADRLYKCGHDLGAIFADADALAKSERFLY